MKSQYLERVPVSRAELDFCYYCGTFMQGSHDSGDRRARTIDHILPKSIGRFSPRLDMDRFNKRPCCVDCNRLRGYFGHCTGLLMMAIIEGERRNMDKKAAAIIVGIMISKKNRMEISRQRKRERRDAKRVEEAKNVQTQ